MDQVKLDFEQAKVKHLQFKAKLRSILYGIEIDPKPVLSHYECGVGKWIYGHALKEYSHIPEMLSLEKVHAEIHVTARELVALYQEGKVEEARNGLNKIEYIATTLVDLLSVIESKITEPSDQNNAGVTIEENLKVLRELERINYDLEHSIKNQTIALQTAKERFDLVSKATQDAIWDWDLKTDNIWWNNAYYETFGYKRGEIETTGQSWVDRIHPDQREEVVTNIHKIIDSGEEQWHKEYLYRKSDGTYAHVFDRGYCLHDHHGKAIRMVGSMSDITQRKNDEKQLLQSKEELKEKNRRLEILYNIGKTISSELDINKIVQAVTDAATEVSGAQFGAFFYNSTNEKGESFLLFTLSGAPKDAFEKFGMPRNTKVFEQTFKGTGVFRSADITKDERYGKNSPNSGMPPGHLPVVSYLAVPVISRSGEVLGGLFFGHPEKDIFTDKVEDIVVSMASQAAIAMDNAKLYESAITSKQKLSIINVELSNKNEELQRTNVDLDNFIYTASHDLKSPVSNIEGLINALSDIVNQETFTKEDIQPIVDMARTSINRFSNTIKDLTTITKIQKDTDTETEIIHFNELIADVKDSMADLIEKNDARIIVDFDCCTDINFSRNGLKSILYNLINNGIKYRSPDRIPEIQISSDKTDEYTILKISDNGLGLEKEKRVKLFSMFKRFHSHVEGSGIGLYLIKRIITNAGGRIEVESEVGVGTTFKVYFKNTPIH